MAWLLKDTDNAEEEIARSTTAGDRIRIFNSKQVIADQPASDLEGRWRGPARDSTGWMTAVGYYFAKTLTADLNGIPVGIINVSRGSSRIQPWIPRPVFDTHPAFAPDRAEWQRALDLWPERKARYTQKLAEWETASAAAKTAGKPAPRRPDEPYGPGHYNHPGGLYNGMVAPLIPYPIRGFLWYQGEANARRSAQYREALPALITSWRQAWGRGDLPFLIVQLAAYRDQQNGFAPDGLERAGLREAQALTAQHVPNTGLVVTLDVSGPESKEHPRNKRPVGERLAHLAEAMVHNSPKNPNGPTLATFSFDGPSAFITYAPGTASGLRTTDNDLPASFVVAGADRVFHPAQARIKDGNTIVLTSPAVSAPVAARYAFCNDPRVNLVNESGLPAAPFRTDDWPLPQSP